MQHIIVVWPDGNENISHCDKTPGKVTTGRTFRVSDNIIHESKGPPSYRSALSRAVSLSGRRT